MKNKHTVVVLFALATIVLTLVFLALPGQFVSLIPDASVSKGAMGGYQFIFGGSIEARNMQAHAVDGAALVSAHGIAFLVLLVIAVVCYVFSKKSSALLLLAGIVMLVATILLFAVKGWDSIAREPGFLNLLFKTLVAMYILHSSPHQTAVG